MSALPPPRDWLPPMAAHLDATLPGSVVEGLTGGLGWLSLRLDGRFLWMVTTGSLRAVWLDDNPVPGEWLDLLGRHRTPFASHLRGQVVRGVRALQTDEAHADGLQLLCSDVTLSVRFWPRPGGLWLCTSAGEEIAQSGRMAGELQAVPGVGDPTFDAVDHARTARAALEAELIASVRTRVRQALTARAKKEAKLLTALERERTHAEADARLRETADVLAAHLHRVITKQSRVELTDFEGQPRVIELDPLLSPAANLDRLYKRAAKSERTLAALGPRLIEQRERIAATRSALDSCDAVEGDLDTLLAFAHQHGIAWTAKPSPRASRTEPAQRLPYRVFRLASGREVRVGRSARDNDLLTQGHAHGHDLWLHAQGVEGSHVVLRTGGRPVPAADVEAAAQLAAQFSKAKHSGTVPVVVTEKRHVRKPRKAAAGSVVAERARTLFVSPGMPPGCETVRPK